jgi:hypothetical protein
MFEYGGAPVTDPAVVRPFWREHLGLVASGILSLILAAKILAVSRFDRETALGVVQVAGTTNVLLASIISTIPLVAPVLLIDAYGRWGRRYKSLTSVERASLLGALTAPILFTLSVVPIAVIGAVAGFFALLVVVLLAIARIHKVWSQRKGGKPPASSAPEAYEPPSRIERTAAALSAYAGIAYFALTSTWMPTEAVTIGDKEPVTAYVVGQRGDQTVYLPTRPAGLRSVDTVSVERHYCDDRTWFDVTLFQAFGERPYPECPR